MSEYLITISVEHFGEGGFSGYKSELKPEIARARAENAATKAGFIKLMFTFRAG